MSESEQYFEQVTDYRFLLVYSGGHAVAIPMHVVIKVCDPLPVTRLPCVEPAVDGLVNLEGTPVLQLNVYRKLFPDSPGATGKLVIIESANYHLALAVDELAGESHEPPEGVHVLDTESLTSITVERSEKAVVTTVLAQHEEMAAAEDMQSCLVFKYAGESYGFRLEHIVEVLSALPVTPLAGAPASIAGVITVRGQTRLVLNNYQYPGLAYQQNRTVSLLAMQYRDRIYMLPLSTGLQMKQFPVSDCLQGNARDESGRPVRLLLPDDVVNAVDQESLRSFLPVETVVQQHHQATKTYLVATIAKQPYALSLDKVRRVLTAVSCQHLLDNTHRVTGLLDLDGRVTPVFDIHHWLGLDRPASLSPRHVVIEHHNRIWTVPVDEISSLIELGDTEIDRIDKPSGCFDGFCRDGERVLPLLAVERIYESLS